MKNKIAENLGTVERERERATLYLTWKLSANLHTRNSINKISDLLNKLFSNKIGSINCAKKYMKINKDRLYVKILQKSLDISLSFLCVKEVMETKDKYA